MAFHVLHEKTEESYDERLSLSLQSVKENSDVQEDLLSKMLLRLNLQLENCRGQHVTVPVRYWEKEWRCYKNNKRATKSICCLLLRSFFKFVCKTTHLFVFYGANN